MRTHERGIRSARRLSAGALLPLLLLGCSADPLAPFEPEIRNTPDSFEFQVTAMRNVTTVRDYDWRNSGTLADVDQATSLTAGTAILIVREAGGAEVYRKDLTANGSFDTASGTAGMWRVRVELRGVSGTVNFRVHTSP